MDQEESNTDNLGDEQISMSPDSGVTELGGNAVDLATMALDTRYNELGDVQDLENIILLHRWGLFRFRPPGHPDRFKSLHNLGAALCTRYDKLGNADDLEEAISLFHDTLSLLPPSHTDYPRPLNNLAYALVTRYRKFGNADDLKDSISLQRKALSLSSHNNPRRAASLINLAVALKIRYAQLGNADDLEESLSLSREALNMLPPGHRDRSASLTNLASDLITRYEQLGNADDLKDGISLHHEAHSLHPPGHPHRSDTLNSLSDALTLRYEISGNVNDLEDVISLQREALSLRPPGNPRRSTSLNNLAVALNTRYENMGNTEDLEDGISLLREALSLQLPGHPIRSTLLNNLAANLSIRYEKLGTDDDLGDSISLQREALSLRPPGHSDRFWSLANLAAALGMRYDKVGDVDDLEDCILLRREALSLCPPGHHHCSNSLIHLASALTTRHNKFGDAKDLEESILLYHDALDLRAPPHPNRSMPLTSLGALLMTRHHDVQMKQPGDFLEAFRCFEQAANDSTSYIHTRLTAAIRWVNSARLHNHETIFAAYTTLLQLTNRSLIFRPNLESQQRFLAGAEIPRSLASDAASVAIEAGKIELAVEFLEQGRALLWSRVDAYKRPLSELRKVTGGNELADRLQAVSAELERLSLVSSSATSNTESSRKAAILDNQMKEHRVLSEEWEDLVRKVCEIPGFSHFLRAAPIDVLQLAAAEGPVILVNVSRHGSDAIILLKGSAPVLVNLPEVLLPELRGQKCGTAKEIASTLAYLWDTIVSPIVDRLTELEVEQGSRIWWCPTGELCSLPLHAAGRGRRRLHDIYVSSYTSTLSSLIRARSKTIQYPTTPKLLLVGQPSTDLKRVQDEVDAIKKLRPGVDVLFGPEANREGVLEGLKDHSWVHFACHGLLGDEGQPFHASFKLHEEVDHRLQLLDLIQARLPNAELAFLSACHSAAGGLSTPDESIHLSAALQFCGFKSVVGTLWEMDDEDGPTISEKFYNYMFRNADKIDFRDSAHALNLAIKEMRKANVPLDRLAMFVHIGA